MDVEGSEASPGRIPAATIAAERVAEVRDRPRDRLELLRSSYAPLPGDAPVHLRYQRAALAFMGWQLRRGLLDPIDGERSGSPWWRAVNERLLRDTCEARARLLGHPGPASSPSVEASIRFARRPSPRAWYLAHNVTIVHAYLDHRDLAEREGRIERFFINLALIRVLYAHALVAAPRLALAWLAPIGPWLGVPRLDLTGMFLSVSRVLPHVYPLHGDLDAYIADEHAFGRLLDLGVITPRLTELYRWSAAELRIPEVTDLVWDATPAYAWDHHDREPWAPAPKRLVRAVRRALPPLQRAPRPPPVEGAADPRRSDVTQRTFTFITATSVTSGAPPEDVYDTITDLDAHVVWSGERASDDTFKLLSVRQGSDGPLGVGATFSSTGANFNGTFHDRSVVGEASRPSVFVIETDAQLDRRHGRTWEAHFTRRYDLEPEGRGTRITYTETISRVNYVPYWLRFWLRPLSRRIIDDGDRKQLQNLADLAEERSSA